jgi:hypothetical protein
LIEQIGGARESQGLNDERTEAMKSTCIQVHVQCIEAWGEQSSKIEATAARLHGQVFGEESHHRLERVLTGFEDVRDVVVATHREAVEAAGIEAELEVGGIFALANQCFCLSFIRTLCTADAQRESSPQVQIMR